MVDVLRIGEIRSGDSVSVDVIGCCPRAGMAGFLRRRRVEMESNGEVGERGGGKLDRLRNKFCSRRYGDFAAPGKGERLVGCWVYGRGCGRQRARDMHR